MGRHYYSNEEKTLRKLELIKELVGEQKLSDSPCPLMLSQLESLKVLLDKTDDLVRDMITFTKEHVEKEGWDT